MRVPLDYYRILGLPIQANADQLQQGHRDRTLQLPRREYSEAAMTARKQLLDEAYSILSEPKQRQAYDASFLARSYTGQTDFSSTANSSDSATDAAGEGVDVAVGEAALQEIAADPHTTDPYTPSIEIEPKQLVGALLILLELGEYEQVIKLGRPYLSTGSISLKDGKLGDPDIVLADIVLTVALACLELGREQWQQGQYEGASESLETGRELLLREGLFANIRGEMQADLYKLRPYRILELVALPMEKQQERQQGLRLLQEMLQDRRGIDGTSDDLSGLDIDDFLRFVQQLRDYLTVAEQQTLFEREARRPSAVATYLAVYALLARGFTDRQPVLIRRAKVMLMRLSARQDIHLEQSVCALLLGQTEEASHALELSQEYEPLAFIREHSQGSPDLLPGLCLYAEQWLAKEVFPHFRDLAGYQPSLKEYFADEQVQHYLEELPTESEPANQWSVVPTGTVTNGKALSASEDIRTLKPELQTAEPPAAVGQAVAPAATLAQAGPGVSADSASVAAAAAGLAGSAAALSAAERVSQLSPEGQLQPPEAAHVARSPASGAISTAALNTGSSSTDALSEDISRSAYGRTGPSRPPLPELQRRSQGPKVGRLILVGLGGLALLALIGILGSWAVSFARRAISPNPLRGEQLQLQLDQPLIEIPPPEASTAASSSGSPLTADINEETAGQLIQLWLNAKADAYGPGHNIEALQSILMEPELSKREQWARANEAAGVHTTYEHEVQVTAIQLDETDPDQATVEANVEEISEVNDRGQVEPPFTDELRIGYDLVRQDGEWRIQGIRVLNKDQ